MTQIENTWRNYVRSIFLDYTQRRPQSITSPNYPFYFQRDLKLSNTVGYLRQLQHQGLLEADEKGCARLTQAGLEAISPEHLQFFRYCGPQITFENYRKARQRLGDAVPFEKVMMTVILERIEQLKARHDLRQIRSLYLDVAQLCEAASMNADALYYYLVCLFYDVSGLDYCEILMEYAQKKKGREAVEKYFFGVPIRPTVWDGLRRQQEYYEPAVLDDIFQKEVLKFNLCTKEQLDQLIRELCAGKYDYGRWKAYFRSGYLEIMAQAPDQFVIQ